VPRVLIYRLGSLGDSLLALPTLHMVRRTFKDAHITILTNAPVDVRAAPLAAILEGMGLYDEVIEYAIGLRGVRGLVGMRKKIAGHKFDLLLNLTPYRGIIGTLRDYIFFRLCNVRKIVGTPLAERRVRKIYEGDRIRYQWEARRIAQRVSPLMSVDLRDDGLWDLRLSEVERGAAAKLLGEFFSGGFLAASIGTKMDAKDWTLPKWMEMFSRLSAAFPRLRLVLLGSMEERGISDRCLEVWSGPKLNLCGSASPRVSAAILARATLFVGHDSGPMHLAATVGVPCVAIFSARNLPGQWFPRGSRNTVIYHQMPCFGCDLGTCAHYDKLCIRSISVDEVLTAVRRYFALSAA